MGDTQHNFERMQWTNTSPREEEVAGIKISSNFVAGGAYISHGAQLFYQTSGAVATLQKQHYAAVQAEII